GADPGGLVVAAGDARVDLVLRDRELLLAELGAEQELEPGGEDRVEALLQAVPAEGGRVERGAALDAGAPRLELVVELVAGPVLRAAGAPGLAVDPQQADLGGR